MQKNQIQTVPQVGYKIDIESDFGIEHVISHPFVMIIGVTTYNKKKSKGWKHLAGVEQDVKRMKDLFQHKLQFGHKTDVYVLTDYDEYKNASKRDIIKFIKLCERTVDEQKVNKYRYDALICIVSGHGIQGSLVASDGKYVDINKFLFNKFNADNIELLANRPKIFIFDTCRGKVPARVKTKFINVRGAELISQNVESGFRISYATTKGKTAPSHETGGAFIQALYDTITNLYEKQRILNKIDFQTILRMTSRKARDRTNDMLCPVHEDYTVYKLYFGCKYTEDNSEFVDTDSSILRMVTLESYIQMKSERELTLRDTPTSSDEETESVRGVESVDQEEECAELVSFFCRLCCS
eukprot:41336_1